ncbi:hypothetical protein SAMN07250955_105254 [Arboricoccus pini]|uniref:Uncharacterized protein n=1 Tax=Arboricoccus pini TaxID=1963835 RepID=A0A212R4Y5_9PROT|nr:hypothetical protein [Arboricoccus pini]SNB67092.1 hypothetical protein SAMN07250955_105254 [Arboricoccus pini]
MNRSIVRRDLTGNRWRVVLFADKLDWRNFGLSVPANAGTVI